MKTKKELTEDIKDILSENNWILSEKQVSEKIVDYLEKENCLKVEKEKEYSYTNSLGRIIFTIIAILLLSAYAYYLYNYISQIQQKDITYKWVLSFCLVGLVINIFLFIIGLIKGLKSNL